MLLSSPLPLQKIGLIYWSLQGYGGTDGDHLRVGAFIKQPGALIHTQTHDLMPLPSFPSSITRAGELLVARWLRGKKWAEFGVLQETRVRDRCVRPTNRLERQSVHCLAPWSSRVPLSILLTSLPHPVKLHPSHPQRDRSERGLT